MTRTGNADLMPTSIAPWLSVQNGLKAIEFYKSAFGAVETYRLEMPDGAVIAKLSIADAGFWISGEATTTINSNPEPIGGGSIRMILTVPDPDALFEQALKAGATQVFAVGEDHGWRLGRLVDPFGLHWEIGHPLN